jgi:hypothetical protein
LDTGAILPTYSIVHRAMTAELPSVRGGDGDESANPGELADSLVAKHLSGTLQIFPAGWKTLGRRLLEPSDTR